MKMIFFFFFYSALFHLKLICFSLLVSSITFNSRILSCHLPFNLSLCSFRLLQLDILNLPFLFEHIFIRNCIVVSNLRFCNLFGCLLHLNHPLFFFWRGGLWVYFFSAYSLLQVEDADL
ncbi:hypothetical protein EDC94DRAFT_618036 [Helicostylum pulchrum]|nr:hypothetical protein EDC94DRAFT_618036 [Helicostylum pulchrum]